MTLKLTVLRELIIAQMAMLLAVVLLAVTVSPDRMYGAELRDVIGAYHYAPKYTFKTWPVTDGTKRDSLNEGADVLLQMGSRVIRVGIGANGKALYWYTANPSFPDNSIYGLAPELRLVEMAKSVQYDTLFRKNFSTIILAIRCNMPVPNPNGGEKYEQFGDCGWGDTAAPLFDGVTPLELATEKAAIKNLAVHLLTTYAKSGKTFVLSTGEGDWIAREPNWGNPDFPITQARADAMRDWVNARADGVAEARAQVGQDGVQVYSSAEVNDVTSAGDPRITMTNTVLPQTHCDLYSYTAYGVNNDAALMLEQLDYVAAQAPDSAAFGSRNVFVGEYAAAENSHYAGDLVKAEREIRRMTEAAVAWGAPYVIFWEVFDAAVQIPNWNMDVMPTNSQMDGFWLVRPDGTKSPIYHYFNRIMFVTATPIALRAYGGGYTSAHNEGGGPIYVNAPQVGRWEHLTLIDHDGGALRSGDEVSILTPNGRYFMAWDNGGGAVEATATEAKDWEKFRVWKVDGTGAITDGNTISFQTGSGHYFVAEGGGVPRTPYIDLLKANRTTVGAWEQFGYAERVTASCASPVITSSTSSTSVPANAAVELTAAAVGATPLNYQWYVGTFPDTSNPLASGATVIVTPSATTDYWLRVSGPCGFTNTATVRITVSASATATKLYTLMPCRLVDTRDSTPLAPSEARGMQITGRCGVPVGARSVAVNVVGVAPTANGNLTLYPADVALPNTNTASYRASRTRATNTIIRVPPNGVVKVHNNGTAPVHVILDVTAYFN